MNRLFFKYALLCQIYNFRKSQKYKRFLWYCDEILGKNNNRIVFITKNGDVKSRIPWKYRAVKVKFYGKNNYFELHEPYNLKNLSCKFLGDGNRLIIKENANIIKKLEIYMCTEGLLDIGRDFSVQDALISLQRTIGSKVIIGKNCLLSMGIIIRTSDAHTIYDVNTKNVINYPKDVIIGNHVWIAQDVKILKGCKIADNCVIGANAIVTKPFNNENCIIVGTPAKIVKKDINWNKCSTNKWDSYKDFV